MVHDVAGGAEDNVLAYSDNANFEVHMTYGESSSITSRVHKVIQNTNKLRHRANSS